MGQVCTNNALHAYESRRTERRFSAEPESFPLLITDRATINECSKPIWRTWMTPREPEKQGKQRGHPHPWTAWKHRPDQDPCVLILMKRLLHLGFYENDRSQPETRDPVRKRKEDADSTEKYSGQDNFSARQSTTHRIPPGSQPLPAARVRYAWCGGHA